MVRTETELLNTSDDGTNDMHGQLQSVKMTKEGDSDQTTEDDPGQDILADMLQLSDQYLHKKYLQQLSQLQIVSPEKSLTDIEPGNNLRLIQLDAVFCEKDTKLSQMVKNLFGAVEAYDAGVLLIVNGKKERVKIYLGVSGERMSKLNPAFDTFLTSLSGTLPGCKYRQLIGKQKQELLQEVFPCLANQDDPEPHAISCISAFPAVDSARSGGQVTDPYEAIAKLDVLIDGMRDYPFTMVLLAQSVSELVLTETQQLLELIYSQLSPYERVQHSASETDTDSVTLNYNHTVNTNKSYSTGLTCGISRTHGTSINITTPEIDEKTANRQAGIGLLSTAAVLAIGLATKGKVKPEIDKVMKKERDNNLMANLFYSSSIANAVNNVSTLMGFSARPLDKQISKGEHDDESVSESKQITFSTTDGTSDSQGYNIGNTKGTNASVQLTQTNKMISGLLWELDRELEQIRRLKREGAFLGAAYFIAGEEKSAVSAANLYRAMTQSGGVSELRSPINWWEDRTALLNLTAYLCRGAHPSFKLDEWGFPTVEAAQFVSLSDIPAYFSLPEHSVSGYIYSDYAGFARDIILNGKMGTNTTRDGNAVNIGNIYHLGHVDDHTPVDLTVNDLTKHLFVTGATGVGKSNFCYHLLDQLIERDIRVLVIEPAKGEYAGVFGGRSGFYVFGTDPNRAPLLRINPFAFPDGVSVVQHVERLLDIFNAAWPMYSAMPAILKEAIETVYAEKGFDLIFGSRPQGVDFPCFSDLLRVLPQIINSSDYSGEVKGNYTGALVTRVKSMTNGIYGIVFGNTEIGDKILFDRDVVVDISRIGSSETKALIMGVLTMRLNEYRMCSAQVNSPLRHVTLLEEAHNLLRTESAGSAEGANIRAASVEMITNAIAEMRTYGEGFIIADQSPGILDRSVVRNTQTKVVFMLPDRGDREIMGDALSLDESQKQELAKLSSGVAAVFQNGWTSTVLTKIRLFPEDRLCPFLFTPGITSDGVRELRSQYVAIMLLGHVAENCSSVSEDTIRTFLEKDFSVLGADASSARTVLQAYLESGWRPKKGEELEMILATLPLDQIIYAAGTAHGSEQVKRWYQHVQKKLSVYISLTEAELYVLVNCGIHFFYQDEAKEKQKFRMLFQVYCKPSGTSNGG